MKAFPVSGSNHASPDTAEVGNVEYAKFPNAPVAPVGP
jgi:hypothetical protein